MITVLFSVGSRYPVNRAKIRSFIQNCLLKENIFEAIVNITIVGERKIRFLNETYLHHEGITDVLSFPQYEKGSQSDYESTVDPTPQLNQHGAFVLPPIKDRNLGDIVVCYPEAVRQAMKRGKLVDDQICSLIEHSLSHLLGKHHE